MYRQMMYHDKLSFSTRLESQFVTRLQDGEDEISLDDLQENGLTWHKAEHRLIKTCRSVLIHHVQNGNM